MIKVNKNDKYGKLSIIEEVGRNKYNARMFKCKCLCGNIKIVSLQHLRAGHTKSCGCLTGKQLIGYRVAHGLSKHHLYKTYRCMLHRCYDTTDTKYENYGGRGITVCDRWVNVENGLKNFISDVGRKPSKKHTLDRIDNDGDYTPENVIWKTYSDQNLNQRKSKTNTSGYTGVSKCGERWRSYIGYNKIRYTLGVFDTREEAINRRNDFIIKNNLKHKIQNI